MEEHNFTNLRPLIATDKYTRRQRIIVFLTGLANLVAGTVVGIQAPFYPKEAELKGATSAEYGLVMGAFNLVVLIMSPVFGTILHLVNPSTIYNLGIFVASISVILFGLLEFVPDCETFISLSFLLRILQACGDAGFVTVAFTIIAMEFPQSVATAFGNFSTCFGVGLVIGPGIGGFLYEIGGFVLPFALMGSCFLVVAFLSYLLLPEMDRPQVIKGEETENAGEVKIDKTGLVTLIKIPVVALALLSVGTSACTTGFLAASLEPHLRTNFDLSPGYTGLMFLIDGSMYAISAPIWGRLVDKAFDPKIITFAGALLTFIAFLCIGPAPFLPWNTILWVICVGLVIHGLGQGASCVSAFIQALNGAVANGFPDNVSTYGLVSGLWMSSYSLGAFVGPSVGGILLDHYDFRKSSLFVLGIQIVVMAIAVVLICCDMRGYLHFKFCM